MPVTAPLMESYSKPPSWYFPIETSVKTLNAEHSRQSRIYTLSVTLKYCRKTFSTKISSGRNRGQRTVLAAARPLYCIYMVCLDFPGHTGKIRMQYHLLIIIQNPRRYKTLPWEHCAEIVVRRKIYSRMRPSTEMVSTCHGINFPLACNAFLAARSSPPQHGTSMRTMVRLLMLFSEKMRVSFSV